MGKTEWVKWERHEEGEMEEVALMRAGGYRRIGVGGW